MIPLADAMHRAGFSAGDPMSIGPCGFHHRHTYAVDPEGHLYKCPGFLGHSAWAMGHVSSGLTPCYDQLAGLRVQGSCGSCAHRPDCAGGCVASTWLASGRAEGVNCENDHFERHRDPLVQRRFALATSATPEEAAARFPPPPVEIPPSPPASPRERRRPAALRVIGQ